MPQTEKKTDRRTLYTRQVIKDTLLDLLMKKSFHKITVTEICKLAQINRGTFYLHYYDMDDVLDDIINDIMCGSGEAVSASGRKPAVPCGVGGGCSYPFCEKIHSEDRYRTLFLDDEISPRILEKIADLHRESYITWLMSHSLLTFEEAEAIFYFQMNGCLTINKLTLRNNCPDWRKVQAAVDQFVKNGLEAFLIHDQRDEILKHS